MGMTRERKLEAALREIISFANDYRRACIPEFVFLNRVLEITTGEALRALATPRTSEWNEAIEAAASVGTLYPSQRASIPHPQAKGAVR